MNPIILTLIRFATASQKLSEATGTMSNMGQKGIEQELALWFRSNIKAILKLNNENQTTACYYKGRMISLEKKEIDLGLNSGKILAVKEYKLRTNKSLLDSKQDVEDFFECQGYTFYGQP